MGGVVRAAEIVGKCAPDREADGSEISSRVEMVERPLSENPPGTTSEVDTMVSRGALSGVGVILWMSGTCDLARERVRRAIGVAAGTGGGLGVPASAWSGSDDRSSERRGDAGFLFFFFTIVTAGGDRCDQSSDCRMGMGNWV